jgi:hypothetical protein
MKTVRIVVGLLAGAYAFLSLAGVAFQAVVNELPLDYAFFDFFDFGPKLFSTTLALVVCIVCFTMPTRKSSP